MGLQRPKVLPAPVPSVAVMREYADERDVIKVRKLMENLQLTLEQALNALDIHGTSRTYIEKRLQK